MPPRTKASSNVYTLKQIVDLLGRIFDFYKRSDDTLRDVTFYQEYPQGTSPEDLELPSITFRIKQRDPSGENSFGSANKGLREIKPRQRESTPDENHPGYTINILAQRYECIVQFDVWATTNLTADTVADAFERFMKTVQGILMDEGLQNIYYRGLKTDAMVTWKDQVTHRIIEYLFLTEDIYHISEKEIEDIIIHIKDIKVHTKLRSQL